MENKELFNNKTKEQPAQRQPMQLGLYDATNEHDACGVGMLVNIHGSKSHELVESALKVLENMRHRGAEGTARIHPAARHPRSRKREIRNRTTFSSER